MQSLAGKTVLVADDSLKVRQEVVRLYEELGMKVVAECENGKEVLERLQEKRPDLVSLDVIMPEMDGFECARIIAERFQEQKVIFVTWLASDRRILERLRSEMNLDLFVAKPIDRSDFAAKVGKLFGVDAALSSSLAPQTGESELEIPISAS